jgi:hypothetical protein
MPPRLHASKASQVARQGWPQPGLEIAKWKGVGIMVMRVGDTKGLGDFQGHSMGMAAIHGHFPIRAVILQRPSFLASKLAPRCAIRYVPEAWLG